METINKQGFEFEGLEKVSADIQKICGQTYYEIFTDSKGKEIWDEFHPTGNEFTQYRPEVDAIKVCETKRCISKQRIVDMAIEAINLSKEIEQEWANLDEFMKGNSGSNN